MTAPTEIVNWTPVEGTPGPPDYAQGPKGDTGATGAPGPQGVKGDTGATGIQGVQGIQGVPGATGPAGSVGATGSAGATGPAGAASSVPGPAGPTGAAGPTMFYRGAWSSGTTYLFLDTVSYNGSSYVATTTVPAGQANPSINASWAMMAQAGASGAPGSQWYTGAGAPAGATGVVGDWYLNSTTGDYYSKTAASTWTLQGNLRGPQGIQGIQGVTGTVAAAGAGTAALPSISFAGDPNTGLYNSNPDEVSISTNGVQRLLVGTLGSVTIGTAGVAGSGEIVSQGGQAGIQIRDRAANTAYYSFYVPSGATGLRVYASSGGDVWGFNPHLIAATDNTVDIGASGANRPRNLYLAGTATVGNGTAAAPAFTFSGAPTSGVSRWDPYHGIAFSANGAFRWGIFADGVLSVFTDNTYDIGQAAYRPRTIYAGTSVVTPLVDTPLLAPAGNVVEQRNGTTFQTLSVYNTYTSGSNYERLSITGGAWFQIFSQQAAPGAARELRIGTSGNASLTFVANNLIRWGVAWDNGAFYANTDNAVDIGYSSSANRPRTIYAGTSVVTPLVTTTNLTVSGTINPAAITNVATLFASVQVATPLFSTWTGAGQLGDGNGGAYLRMLKNTSAQGAPGAGIGVLYFRDGTNASTLKLVVRAGAAGAETTVLDNIPT